MAPLGVGYLHDVTGSYHTGFVLLIGVALAGAVAILALPSPAAIASRVERVR
jgi:cyanate permease